VGSTDRADGIGVREQPFDRFFEFVGQLLGMFRDKAREVVTFEVLPEAFDRIEVGTVGREVERLDVVPVQRIGVVPTGVVEMRWLRRAGASENLHLALQ
jgi:hypothetical protein